jgi:hypothetical protein
MPQFPYPLCSKCQNQCVIWNAAKGKVLGRHNEPLCCYLDQILPTGDFDSILNQVKKRIEFASKQLHPTKDPPGEQSLKNLKGAWFENLVAVIAWNAAIEFSREKGRKVAIFLMPNEKRMKFWELYDKDEQNALKKIFGTLSQKGVTMTLSNPDMLCISNAPEEVFAITSKPVAGMALSELKRINAAYQSFKGKCRYDSIRFGVATKSTLRPDRRYQIVYEGSLVKAITKLLGSDLGGPSYAPSYYGIVPVPIGPMDRIVFTNPTIDSLLQKDPVKAVDQIQVCGTVKEAQTTITDWLNQKT